MRISTLLIVLGMLAAAMGGAGVVHASGAVVRCESSDGQRRVCAADTRGGVRLRKQLSKSACIEGETWGARREGVWVDRGCRGDFETAMGYGTNTNREQARARILRCESGNGRSNFCPIDTRAGVELQHQLSRNACIRGQSWGVDSDGIWVSGGCRAEFRVGVRQWRNGRYEDERRGYSAMPQRLRCESSDGHSKHCDADTRGGARLVKQLSRAACTEGRSWGYDRRGVWVTDGCRAEFETRGVD